MKHKISRGLGWLLVKMKHLKGDIVYYTETVLEETSNILLPVSVSVSTNYNGLVTLLSD